MSNTQRLEARGPRGEACIIVRTMTGDCPSYRLGSGDRLAATNDPAVFETPLGKRRFVLRSETTSVARTGSTLPPVPAPNLAPMGAAPAWPDDSCAIGS